MKGKIMESMNAFDIAREARAMAEKSLSRQDVFEAVSTGCLIIEAGTF